MAKVNLQFKLPVTFLREDKKFVAYTPALDLSTSGKTYNEAKRRFEEAVELFFEETAKAGKLADTLKDLGWKKVNKKWKPPLVISQEAETISIPAY